MNFRYLYSRIGTVCEVLNGRNNVDHGYCAKNDILCLRPLRKDDIEQLRIWRNNQVLSGYLTPIEYITPKMQLKWFEKYLLDDNSYFFVIEDLEIESIIGTVALYDLKADVASIGKIVIGNTSLQGKGLGYSAFVMSMLIGCRFLGINEYNLNVCKENEAAYHLYKRIGFKECGSHEFHDGMEEMEMKITRAEFESMNEIISDIECYVINTDK